MNILTFDIEEWFHLLDNDSTKTEREWDRYEQRIYRNMDTIFEILDKTDTRATFFCLGWVARKYPNVIKRIDAAGFEIATHSDLHQLAYEQDRKTFTNDLVTSINALQDITGKKIRAYRAPGFSLMEANKWVFEVLVENGIEIDCSIFPAQRAHGGFANFGAAQPCWVNANGMTLKEFPINLHPIAGQNIIFSGGGYFRFFPYALIRHLSRQTPYIMTYFHPRDFDAEQPMVEGLSLPRKFKSYYGLAGCRAKLERLLTDFDFIDLQQAEQQMDWTKTPTIIL